MAFGARWKPRTGNRGKGAPFALCVVNADGTGLEQISPPGLDVARDGMEWSPDGDWIAFSTRLLINYPRLRVVHPDGSGPRKLTQSVGGDVIVGPVWSPDSTQVLFQGFHPEVNGGQEDLWIVNVDGSRLRRLTDALGPSMPGEEAPVWGTA